MSQNKQGKAKYILLKDQVAKKKEKGLLNRHKNESTHVLRGSLWQETDSTSFLEKKHPDRISLASLEFDGVVLDCHATDVRRITNTDYNLLIALSTCSERCTVEEEEGWLQEGEELDVGAIVYVIKQTGLPERAVGRIRYKGELPAHNGTWFGIELSAQYHGKGTSDGVFRGKTYFKCLEDSAVFVCINKVRRCPTPGQFLEHLASPRDPIKDLEDGAPVKVGDRVVWMSDYGPEPGVVKWVGVLPDQRDGPEPELTVGVEFDKPVGTGTGKYKDKQLFRAKLNHASLIPIMGLIKEDALHDTGAPDHDMAGFQNQRTVELPNTRESGVTSPRYSQHERSYVRPATSHDPPAYRSQQYNNQERQGGEEVTPLDLMCQETGLESSRIIKEQMALYREIQREQQRQERQGQERLSRGHHANVSQRELQVSHPSPRRTPIRTTPSSSGGGRREPMIGRQSESPARSALSSNAQQYTRRERISSSPRAYVDEQFDNNQWTGGDSRLVARGTDIPVSRSSDVPESGGSSSYDNVSGRSSREVGKSRSKFSPVNNKILSNNQCRTGIEHKVEIHNAPKPSHGTQITVQADVNTSRLPRDLDAGSDDLERDRDDLEQPQYKPYRSRHDHIPTGGEERYNGVSRADNRETLVESVNRTCSVGPQRPKNMTRAEYMQEDSQSFGRADQGEEPETDSPVVRSPTGPRPQVIADGEESRYTLPRGSQQLTSQTSSSGASQGSWALIDEPGQDASPATSHNRNSPLPGRAESPISVDPSILDTDLEIGSMVEVLGNPPKYGVIRWIGYCPWVKDPSKPIAGLEMEEENSACTDGTFQRKRLFHCAAKKGFFVYLNKCRKDQRFEEHMSHRTPSTEFGDEDSPDVGGTVAPPSDVTNIAQYCGQKRGIQGHHNSCYLDATLFSMFAFTTVFDGMLHRPMENNDIEHYHEVQLVLKESIVNPLRQQFYVRADKILKLRKLLDKLSSIEGLMTDEKDPEEFLNSLLQQIMKVEPFIRLNNGQESFFYQLFMEKDEHLILPTIQQLLGLSFLQSDIKLAETPSCLILQMPRFGKDYKLYNRIVPSLYLDVTDLLEYAPRECVICGDLAVYECRDCVRDFTKDLDRIPSAFCGPCVIKAHSHGKRLTHKYKQIKVEEEYTEYHQRLREEGAEDIRIPRQTLELFAVVCIQTSHYVTFVKCGSGPEAPWLFFDSMADRIGQQHGYNIPEVQKCPELARWLSDDNHEEIIKIKDDKNLPEYLRRMLCDAYICMYQSTDVMMYK